MIIGISLIFILLCIISIEYFKINKKLNWLVLTGFNLGMWTSILIKELLNYIR